MWIDINGILSDFDNLHGEFYVQIMGPWSVNIHEDIAERMAVNVLLFNNMLEILVGLFTFWIALHRKG